MGSGKWDVGAYAATTRAKVDAGTAFGYSRTVGSMGRDQWSAHEDLDPKRTNKAGAHEGSVTRESLDSDEHPTSTAIAVLFDVTGSMGRVPRQLQQKLPQLLGTILRKGYVEHPQILFGAIGDATCDRVPLQISQFESDNRMDDHLDNIFLEGHGGGQKKESYELAAFFMSRHTYLDCYEKRGHKGFLFIVGDELSYPHVSVDHVRKYIGDESPMEADIPTEAIFEELKEKYEVFYLLPAGTSYYNDPAILEHWEALLGVDRVLKVQDVDVVVEVIAMSIGIVEGTVDIDAATEDLRELGSSDDAVEKAKSSVTALATKGSSGTAVVTAEGPDPDAGEDGLE